MKRRQMGDGRSGGGKQRSGEGKGWAGRGVVQMRKKGKGWDWKVGWEGGTGRWDWDGTG